MNHDLRVAQQMLDIYGYFVVITPRRFEIGHRLHASEAPCSDSAALAGAIIVGLATEQDAIEQLRMCGPRAGRYQGLNLYRAVAE
jgi:hypothetical protein